MSALTLEKPKLTTKELIEKLNQTEGKAEIINGEIVEFMATGCDPGLAAFYVAVNLRTYEKETKLGKVFSDNVGFLVNLPNRKSFSPDASFFTGERAGMKFIESSPIFAVEVRSENDYCKKAEESIKQKRYNYFAAGTEVVWDVDLLSDDVIKSYHKDNPNEPKLCKRGEIADAEPALPGWKMPVDELFE